MYVITLSVKFDHFFSILFFVFRFFKIMFLGGGSLRYLQNFLQCIKQIILGFTLFSPLPALHSWNSFSRYSFYIYRHVYTVFVPYSPSHALSLTPPLSHWYQHPPSCSLILLFLFNAYWNGKYLRYHVQ
jgi:hypothetical protein